MFVVRSLFDIVNHASTRRFGSPPAAAQDLFLRPDNACKSPAFDAVEHTTGKPAIGAPVAPVGCYI